MQWRELKAELLSLGTARLEGEPASGRISSSTAGPGAGGRGSIFFSAGGRRVRLAIDPASSTRVIHMGNGRALLRIKGEEIEGELEQVALHCPRQAYLTVSSGCIFSCAYCEVPAHPQKRKPISEILAMVEGVADRIDAISLTSGVMGSVEEEESYVLEVVRRLVPFGIPIGVSIYPTDRTAGRLHALGVREVKFNVETANDDLFGRMCPGLSRDAIWKALDQSVPIFGRGHVFSNLIIGLGETDDEAGACIRELTSLGVIPVIRPLSPAAGCRGFERPSKERILAISRIHADAMKEAGLDPRTALTMCAACTGCDLVPGRDDT